MAKYRLVLNHPDTVQDTETGAFIPRGHRWWDDYEQWVTDGNTPEAADEPPVEPITVTAAQLRKALTQAGLRTAVEDAVTNSVDQDLKDDWEYAPNIRSDNTSVVAMATGLGVSQDQLRQLFEVAVTL